MAIVIGDMKKSETHASATIACNSPIGKQYEFTQESLATSFVAAMERGELLLVARSGATVAGFAWIDPRGAFSTAPYLRLIAVDDRYRGQHIGSLLLEAFEEKTRYVGRDYVLLVSDFNSHAIAFYAKHGYEKRGTLPNFARKGITECIMVKKREHNGL